MSAPDCGTNILVLSIEPKFIVPKKESIGRAASKSLGPLLGLQEGRDLWISQDHYYVDTPSQYDINFMMQKSKGYKFNAICILNLPPDPAVQKFVSLEKFCENIVTDPLRQNCPVNYHSIAPIPDELIELERKYENLQIKTSHAPKAIAMDIVERLST
jgi:hypothetical protein